MIVGAYLSKFLDAQLLKKTIENVIAYLKPYSNKFQTIAFTGNSGAIVAPSVAAKLGKNLILVRKEKSHSGYSVEGIKDGSSYLIIDDVVHTGDTIRRIKNAIDENFPENKCFGICLYNQDDRFFQSIKLAEELKCKVFFVNDIDYKFGSWHFEVRQIMEENTEFSLNNKKMLTNNLFLGEEKVKFRKFLKLHGEKVNENKNLSLLR